RFEFNNAYRDTLVEAGLVLSGVSPDNHLVEIIELQDHPWFIGVQFHPEFKSTPRNPHPLFRSFIGAALEHRNVRTKGARKSGTKTLKVTKTSRARQNGDRTAEQMDENEHGAAT